MRFAVRPLLALLVLSSAACGASQKVAATSPMRPSTHSDDLDLDGLEAKAKLAVSSMGPPSVSAPGKSSVDEPSAGMKSKTPQTTTLPPTTSPPPAPVTPSSGKSSISKSAPVAAGGSTSSGSSSESGSYEDKAPTPTVISSDARIVQAQIEFIIEEERFLSAGNECGSMCKALASMKRATEHLCELTQGGSGTDQKRCIDAKAKLESAQAKVKASCPACSS